MRLGRLSILTALFSFGIAVSLWVSARNRRPVDQLLTSDPASFEFQREKDGARTHPTVRLTNHSRAEIVVEGIRKSCSCFGVGLPVGARIPPHTHVDFELSLNLPDIGEQASSLAIDWRTGSEALQSISIPILLKGRTLVPPYTQNTLNSVALSWTDRHQPVTREVELCTIERRTEPNWIVGCDSDNADVTTVLQSSPDADYTSESVQRCYLLRLTYHPPDKQRKQESIKVQWRLRPGVESVKPPAPLVLQIEHRPALAVIPQKVRLGIERREAEAVVLVDEQQQWNLIEVVEQPAWIDVVFDKSSSNRPRKVRFLLIGDPPVSDHLAPIVMRTSHPLQPLVSFPIAIVEPQ